METDRAVSVTRESSVSKITNSFIAGDWRARSLQSVWWVERLLRAVVVLRFPGNQIDTPIDGGECENSGDWFQGMIDD